MIISCCIKNEFSIFYVLYIYYSLRVNGRLFIVMEDLFVILNVKDGFYYDLNVNVSVEFRVLILFCII